MLEGISPNEIDENIITMYKELSNIYTEKILKEKKEIKGKDLKDIINIKDLMQKYYELNGESPIYDDDYIFDDNNINLEYNDFDL
jgi:predicted nucleotidyltransferase component of viral defense system